MNDNFQAGSHKGADFTSWYGAGIAIALRKATVILDFVIATLRNTRKIFSVLLAKSDTEIGHFQPACLLSKIGQSVKRPQRTADFL
ncbi:MAG: hypothetical protein OEY05_14330 [Paracoccaceae bacterium]|nr:hypothetical protein [Paracoccaceae bacterium]